MCLISIRATGRTLARIVSASVVRIALSATLATPQPTVALQAVIDTTTARSASVVRLAQPTEENSSAAAMRDKPAPMSSGFVGAEPGLGWG